MITLDKVKNIKFNKSGFSGYKATEVDDFIDQVEELIGSLTKKCEEGEKKVRGLTEKLSKYESDESYMRDVLVSAKKRAESEIRDAKYKSDCIISEAVEKSNEIVKTNELKIKEQENLLIQMRKEVTDFKSKLLNEYKSHLKMLSAIEKGYADCNKNEEQPDEKQEVPVDQVKQDKSENQNNDKDRNENILKKFDKLGGIKFGKNYSLKEDIESPISLFK